MWLNQELAGGTYWLKKTSGTNPEEQGNLVPNEGAIKQGGL